MRPGVQQRRTGRASRMSVCAAWAAAP